MAKTYSGQCKTYTMKLFGENSQQLIIITSDIVIAVLIDIAIGYIH